MKGPIIKIKIKYIRIDVNMSDKKENRDERDASIAVAVQYNVAFIITVCLLTTIVKRSLFHMIQFYFSIHTLFFLPKSFVFRCLTSILGNVCSCTFSVFLYTKAPDYSSIG